MSNWQAPVCVCVCVCVCAFLCVCETPSWPPDSNPHANDLLLKHVLGRLSVTPTIW